MPIFEYRCGSCGETFDLLIRHGSPSPRCPACSSEDVTKLISLSAVSSEHTQKRALRGAKQRVAKQRYDRQYEDHKIAHEHDHD